MKDMKKKWYEDIEELCEDVVDTYESLGKDYPVVSVIAKYDEAKEIISNLCKLDYQICDVLIEDSSEGYKDEYLIELIDDGIYCMKLKFKDRYIWYIIDYIFVLDNCNSKLLGKIDVKHEIYEVSFDDDSFDFAFEEEDGECELSVDSDGDMHGFTVNRNSDDSYSSLSFYSTEKLCACELEHLLDIFRL